MPLQTQQEFVAITLDDGQTAVMGFITLGRGSVLPYGATWFDQDQGWWAREASPENIAHEIARTFHHAGPKPVQHRRIALTDVPPDRTYRNALHDPGNGSLGHDMPRARAIHMRRVREARDRKLGQLDRDWMKHAGRGEQQLAQSVEGKRQQLRDLPATIDLESASTVEELKAKWPSLVDD